MRMLECLLCGQKEMSVNVSVGCANRLLAKSVSANDSRHTDVTYSPNKPVVFVITASCLPDMVAGQNSHWIDLERKVSKVRCTRRFWANSLGVSLTHKGQLLPRAPLTAAVINRLSLMTKPTCQLPSLCLLRHSPSAFLISDICLSIKG